MSSLYEDPWFTFHFADNRKISRFHLDGVATGRDISVFKIDPESGARRSRLARGRVGEGGWVELSEPIVMQAGEAFIAVSD
jgi:hypothetical protein